MPTFGVQKHNIGAGQWFREYKQICSLGGESRPACLTFHHRDPSEKLIKVSIPVVRHNKRERVLAEIAKCDVLCANCHADLHFSHLYEADNERRPR